MNDPVRTNDYKKRLACGRITLHVVFGIIGLVGLGLLLCLAFASLTGGNVPAFPPALESWTKWVASVLAIIATVRGLWAAATWVGKRAEQA
jgi:hypothetical protein